MYRILVALFFFLFLTLTHCSKGPGFVRNYGEQITVTRQPGAFNKLKLGQRFRLYLLQDTTKPELLTIDYGSNLIEKIESKISDGELEIVDKNSANWVRKTAYQPVCTLRVRNLNKISINGAAELSSIDTLYGDRLEVSMNSVGSQYLNVHCGQLYGGCINTGNMTFRGIGTIFAWSCENGSFVDAGNLKSDDAYIYHYTVRDIFVNPKNFFEVTIYNSGNVYYRQEPAYTFKQNIKGIGKVIKQ